MNELILDNPVRRSVMEPQRREGVLAPLRRTVGAVWSRPWLAIVVGIAIFAAVAGMAIAVPRYYAQAIVVIQPDRDTINQPDQAQTDLPPDSSAIDTEVEILRSTAIADAVAKRLQLYKDPAFGGSRSATATPDAVRKAANAVIAGSRIRRIGLTYAIQVGFVASTMARATLIANAIVAAYMARKVDEKLATITRANHELGAALGGLRDQALQAEERVEDYTVKYGLLNANGTSMTEGELTALNQKIADAQADTAEKQARVAAAMTQAAHGGGGDVGATLASPTIGALRQREADMSAQLAQLETQFGPQYPQVQKTQAELSDIRQALSSETNRIMSSLRADADAAERREASLLASRQQVEDMLANSNRARAGLLTLQQAADSAKTIYETYLKRASEVTAERGLQQPDATLESSATPEPAPLSSLRVILVGALVLALIGAVLVVLLVDMWTPRIRSLREVQRDTGFPVAGLIPDVSAMTRTIDAPNHVADNPFTVVAEAYRNLGAYLSVLGAPNRCKVIAVTSAVPGEGKTTLSICLARTLAARGSRVVLLDCDLRRASASRFFDKPRYGVTEVIGKSVPVEQALVRDRKSGLWFLSASASGETPMDLFSSKRVEALLAKLCEQFDHVVLDCPPLLGAADARILAASADQVLYLIEWNKTPASIVRAAVEILRQCHARVAGVVLNKVNVRKQSLYGFADGSDYYHRYGSTYPRVA